MVRESAYHELHLIRTEMDALRGRLETCEQVEDLWVGFALQEVASALAMLDQALGQ